MQFLAASNLVPATAASDPAALVAAGLLAGLAATVANLPVSRQPEGYTPAYVVVSAVRGRPIASVRFSEAGIVYHAAGLGAGLAYVLARLVVDPVVPSAPSVGTVALGPHVISVVLVVLFVYAAFAHLMLPRATAPFPADRATAVRGQWLRSVLVLGAGLAVFAPVMEILVAGL